MVSLKEAATYAMEAGDAVELQWFDIIAFGGWRQPDIKDQDYHAPNKCINLGFITYVNDNHLTISGSKGINDYGVHEYNCHMSIPFGCISSLRYIGTEEPVWTQET